MGEQMQRDTLLLIYSLLLRSPSLRRQFEKFPARFGLPESEGIGTANIYHRYRTATQLCEEGLLPLLHFVILKSRGRNFVAGDGYLDWLTGSLHGNHVSGRALIPLTPSLCLYVCTLSSKRSDAPDCTAVSVSSRVVEQVNELTQIYSGKMIFFKGKRPNVSDYFKQGQFLQHSDFRHSFVDQLDEKAGREKKHLLGSDVYV